MARSPETSLALLEISAGNVPGSSHVFKFGRNPDVDTTTLPETVWNGGGFYVPPTEARLHDIVSTSALDVMGGTGGENIYVEGLDANGDSIFEVVPLSGLGTAVTTQAYLRLFRAFIVDSGSLNTNQGDITVTAQVDLTVSAVIKAEDGQTEMAVYTVPRGHSAYLYGYFASIARPGGTSGAMAIFEVMTMGPITSPKATIRKGFTHGISVTGTSDISAQFDPPTRFPELTDICVNIVTVTDNNSDVSAALNLVVRKN